ncbi:sensor histidine kinase [Pseudonocardia sp.]|jgi:signal transduction histidine kinase|uniref:sensor histidine kinase n=1 Tax=Pseudonocardia sp. TaxID=60912 RepID=UPI0031FDC643
MSRAHLRFASDILRRLGEELNPNPDQGILELVKNAYDADARKCTVELKRVTNPGGTLIVSDNGDGMSGRDIRDGWLVLGRSQKVAIERTRLQRIPAGSKGLGRLAALRMGDKVNLTSRPRRPGSREYHLEIDWNKFDAASMVDDVVLDIASRNRPAGRTAGTELKMSGLKLPVGRMDVKRLARALILLADPFGDDPSGFRPVLKAPEFTDLERLVESRYFEDADFHLEATVDASGLASASVRDWRGDALYQGDHKKIVRAKDKGSYDVPPCTFDLWAYLLSRESFATRSVTIGEVQEWLGAFGGVHLYINGLRVSPYGNAGNDWLEMNLLRARNPQERPSTNTALGRISITDLDAVFSEKTDRAGLIENHAYHELRRFAQDALEWMARERLREARRRRSAERKRNEQQSKATRDDVEDAIDDAPDTAAEAIRSAFRKYDQARQDESDALRREVQLYRTLSTAGITAATFAHESSGNPLKVINLVTRVIEHEAKTALDGAYDETLAEPIADLKKATRSLSVLSSVTLALVNADKRRVGRVDIQRVVRDLLKTYRPLIIGRDVRISTSWADGEPYLQATEASVESIATNLLNNSLTAFERAGTSSRRIDMTGSVGDQRFVLSVADNGPGLVDIDAEDVWLPGETRTEGTGLGLAIVHDAVLDLGGDVTALSNGRLGGAEFLVELPILGT